MNYELQVSIPMKGLPQPLFFLDTPPTTPGSTSNSAESLADSPLPPTPRTPRKPSAPRQSCNPSHIQQSTIIRFQMSALDGSGTPSLQIMATTRGHSLDRVRKRLQWDQQADIDNDWETETPIKKTQKRHAITSRRTDGASEVCRYNADADDEMEIDDGPLLGLPSPPYSPEEYPTNSCKASKKKTNNSYLGSCVKVKTCASCKTRKTPLWRDSEDGTPYCNACGIRYKKYRIRCPVCSYIPHKDENINNICCICGASLLNCKFRSR